MPTTGVVNSTLLTLLVDSTAIGCATDVSLNITSSTREILCKDTNGWQDLGYGFKSWSVSASGLFAFDATYGGVDLIDDLIAGTEVTVLISTEVSGDDTWTGTGILTSVTIDSSGVGENVTYSVEIQGDGTLTKGSVA